MAATRTIQASTLVVCSLLGVAILQLARTGQANGNNNQRLSATGIPSALAVQGLAKSPASQQLAEQFFASERTRESRFRAQSALTPVASSSSSSRQPVGVGKLPTIGRPVSSRSPSGALRLDQYNSLEDIYAFIDSLPLVNKQVQVFTIGHTQEKRPIKAIEIVNNHTDPDLIWLDALTHAREWVTGSTLLYIIDEILAGPGSGSAEAQMLHSKNYIIIPVVNPDGYAFTWTSNRMWRKNRSRSPTTKCVGADLNRNFDHSFGGEGASNEPCSHIYSGAYPFSEAETRSMADLMWSLRDRIKFYLTIHSYNQLWACPYASTKDPSASLQKHMRVLRQIQRAVREAEGVQYEIGPLSTSLYVGSGFGIDFAYDKCKIEHSYLVELRDKGDFGFVLPPEQILPTARETLAGLQAGLRAAFN